MLYALFIPFPIDQGNFNAMNIYIYQPNRPIVQQNRGVVQLRQQIPQQHHQTRAVHNLMTQAVQQQRQQSKTFPELVGRPPRVAATYVSARGYHPFVITEDEPVTRDVRMDRVRIVVDPTRQFVIKPPMVG
ncbi:unnamed protein product [Adineta ricciae]|uniref:Uncharacterized protein n=1 Tax=Adineta ricciae TaxID=249248 RepID=A0A813PAW0_ADIRI|nr:unnamed protein product [Adineta ricciae]CAF0854835.1 unnamed protein product [Adineta ricciae]